MNNKFKQLNLIDSCKNFYKKIKIKDQSHKGKYKLKSGFLDYLHYDSNYKVLTIYFKDGRIYEYYDFTEGDYRRFLVANCSGSASQFFHIHIKDRYITTGNYNRIK